MREDGAESDDLFTIDLTMTKLQDEIATKFLEKLRESPDVTPAMVDRLRELLSGAEKLTADDVETAFAPPSDRDVK